MMKGLIAFTFMIVLAVLASLDVISAQSATASVTPTASPSFASTPSPSSSPRPLAYGAVREVLTLDCNGGLHLLPNHPLETNFNLRGVRQILNWMGDEIRSRVQCAADRHSDCYRVPESEILALHVPSVEMLLNFLQPLENRVRHSETCAPHFARSFWDESAMSTVVATFLKNWTNSDIINIDRFRQPHILNMPESCNYESYTGGVGCKFAFRDGVTGVSLNVAVDRCPNSLLPYVSVSCKGSMCERFLAPCVDSSECSTGLQCRSFDVNTTSTRNSLQALLTATSFLNEGETASSCSGGQGANSRSGLAYLAQQVRNKLYSMWNSTAPTSVSSSVTDVMMCLPPVDVINATEYHLKNTWNITYDIDLSKNPRFSPTKCAAAGCNALRVGDGVCDLNCFVEDCKFDGGDCGGEPTEDFPNTYYNRDINSRLSISRSLLNISSRSYINIHRICNGIGTPASASSDICTCNPFGNGCPSGFVNPSRNEGFLCENCLPVKDCMVEPCTLTQRIMAGMQSLFSSWDGVMYDGSNVLDFDRKSGIRYSTPAIIFDTRSQLGALQRPVLQMTCAGEISLNLLNGFLGISVHGPWIQDATTFYSKFVTDLAQCRLQGVASGQQFSFQQLETRFQPHHPAFWAYQMLYLGTDYDVNKRMNTLVNVYGANDERSFGNFLVTDPLSADGMAREPNPTQFTGDIRNYQNWTRRFRMYAPANANVGDSCSYYTTVEQGNRRCRARSKILNSLFQSAPSAQPVPAESSSLAHRFNFDMRVDQCTGAAYATRGIVREEQPSGMPLPVPVGPGASLPAPTLNPSTAPLALPAMSLVYEGVLTQVMGAPQLCQSDNDCETLYPGGGTVCQDLDALLFNWTATLGGANVDPFGMFVYGLYNVDRVNGISGDRVDYCSSSRSVKNSIKNLMIGLGGRRRQSFRNDIALPKFCAPRLAFWLNQQTRDRLLAPVLQRDTCNPESRTWNSTNSNTSLCVVAPAVSSPRPMPLSKPQQWSGWETPDRDYYPAFNQGGQSVNYESCSSGNLNFPRNPGTFANGAHAQFAVSLPVWTRRTFLREQADSLRWAIASALSMYNAGVSPDNIILNCVIDNPNAFTPLPDGSRAGISVVFTVDAPSQAALEQIATQFLSSTRFSLATAAGSLMSSLGLVPYVFQRSVAFEYLPPLKKGLSGGAIFAIVFFVLLFVGGIGLYVFLKLNGYKLSDVPIFKKILGLGKRRGKASKPYETVTINSAGIATDVHVSHVAKGLSKLGDSENIVKSNPLMAASTVSTNPYSTASVYSTQPPAAETTIPGQVNN